MDAGNLSVDAAGRPVVLDSGEIARLPDSLDLYTLFRALTFARRVAAQLSDPDEATHSCAQPNLASMAGVRTLSGQAAGPDLSMSIHSYFL